MFRIGEFSKLAKTTIKTLRYYDEIELFKPEFVDDNGYRYYSIEQLAILQNIVQLRKINMPIEKIKLILEGYNAVEILQKRELELQEEVVKNKINISLIKNIIEKTKKGDFMKSYKAKEIQIPECIFYTRKGVIDTMQDLPTFILQAGSEVKNNNPTLTCVQPSYCFVIYGSKEYKEKDVEVEYFEAVTDYGIESENIKFTKLPQQKAISVMHKGLYSKLGEAYAYAVNWVKEQDLEISGAIRENYIHGCWDCDSEDEYLTEIQIPII